MTTKYLVVRYLPRPLSGEAINIGVIAWSDDSITTRFIQNWQRVRAFGREDIAFLRDFVQQVESSTSAQQRLLIQDSNAFDARGLEKLVETWRQSIEFSEPRVSLKSPEEVLREVAPIYLLESQQHRHRARDHRTAAKLAVHYVREVLVRTKGWQAENLIKKQHSIPGKIEQHVFDVVVANGRPLLAAQGLSFEKSATLNIQRDIDATAWAIDDVRNNKAFQALPVAVLALGPSGDSQPFVRAQKIFRALHASMVSETEMKKWVKKETKVLPVTSSKLLSA